MSLRTIAVIVSLGVRPAQERDSEGRDPVFPATIGMSYVLYFCDDQTCFQKNKSAKKISHQKKIIKKNSFKGR